MSSLADPMLVVTKPARWREGLFVLLLVGAVHVAVLFGVAVGLRVPMPEDFKPPTLSGVLVAEASQQITPPVPAPKPPPKPAPVAQRKPPPTPVKASPTERSITMPKAEPQDKPAPPAPMDATVAQAPAAPAPAAAAQTSAATEPAAAPPVVPPLADASHLNNPAPVYPMGARRRNEQGVVYLSVLVLVDGTVGNLSLKRTSGYPELDESALKAVARWRFVPASRGGKSIDWRYTLPVAFSLNP